MYPAVSTAGFYYCRDQLQHLHLSLLKITNMIERFQHLTAEALQARLDNISPTIELLTDVWRNPSLEANIIAAWGVPDTEDATQTRVKVTEFNLSVEDDSFDDLLQFIHNYCTKLCAEKLTLKFLLDNKKQDIACP